MPSSSSTARTQLSDRQIKTWYRAVLGLFFASGLVVSALLTRLPDVANGLGVSSGPMGLLLLGMTIGSFCAVSFSGALVARHGAIRCIAAAYTTTVTGMILIGLGVHLTNVPVTLLGLMLQGLGSAVSNVASNVQGVANERALGRYVTPIMHGFFSIGTVIGAAIGTLDTRLGVPFAIHMLYFALAVAALVLISLKLCHSEHYGQDDTQAIAAVGSYRVRDAWRDKHTILIGLFVLGMALAEGSANDWVALALTHDYGTSNTIGSLGYFTFVVAMMAGRFGGTTLLNRYGRIPVLRATCTLAILGLAIFILAPTVPLGFIGLVLWGLGASLGFPTGMSAASDDPLKAAVRVSVVSTIGYAAFLGGPPLLGLLGEHFGIRNGLIVVLVFVAVSLVLTSRLNALKPGGAVHTEKI
ncbi:MFS transporter [Rothia nasimurium]|uniref:MFS transporter n=1 Tax=Rothia nasimurium TaxID=85336 RepID=UPI001F327ED3|nr:MFS transporter [Rothia nasimurium]